MANFLHDRIVAFRHLRRRSIHRAVAHHHNAFRRDALSQNAIAHVITENDHARRLPERPPMQRFPARHPFSRAHDLAAQGHVWIHVADVVNERPPGQPRDESPGDSRDGRIGHRQNNIGTKRQRARHCEREVGKIIGDAAAHLMARVGCRADAFDRDFVKCVTAQQGIRVARIGIVGRAAGHDSNPVALR